MTETRTESGWCDWIAERLVNDMPEAISKLRPNSTFTYEIDPDSFQIFIQFPKKTHEIVQRGVYKACCRFWSEFKVIGIEDELLRKQQIVKDNLSGRNKGLDRFQNIKVNLEFYPTVSMRDIGPDIEKEPIVVDGRIMAVSEKRGYLKEGVVFCPNGCDTDDVIHAGPTLRSFIPKCPTCKNKMHLRTSTAITEYVQTIRLQELQDESIGKSRITFDVKVTGNDVFRTWIGKRVRIAGHFLTDIVMNGNQQEHKQFIFSKYMHEIDEVNDVCLSRERADEIKELLKDEVNIQRLFKSYAPKIEGKMLQKEILMYSFVGGSPSEVRRIDINTLEIGNAGEGKSELIKQVVKVIAKSSYFLGNSATAAGLGIGMVKLDNQTSAPMGGPLVECSPHGTVVIDELDKMHDEDQKALLSCMEQQVVTKIVAGTKLILDALVSIIAAANPKYGNWDTGKGIPENINFSPYLLTRFDIVTCSVKTNAIKKQAIAAKILGLEPITKEQELTPLMDEQELLQYINYCKKFEPRLTEKAKRMLNDFYQSMSELTEDEDKVVPMTPRELEGMIRLSTARAKLLQKTIADESDVQAIINLKKNAIESFPGIKVIGGGQQLNLLTEMDKKQKSKEDIIHQLKDENGLVDASEVQKQWVEEGVFKTQSKAEQEFQKMVGETMFMRGSKYKYKY